MAKADITFLAWLRNLEVVKVYKNGLIALLIGRMNTTTQAYKSAAKNIEKIIFNELKPSKQSIKKNHEKKT